MLDEGTKVNIHGYVDSRLRTLIEELADAENIAMSECVAQLLAKAVGRPDLAGVPRKRMGRPRKPADIPEQAKKGKRTKANGKQ